MATRFFDHRRETNSQCHVAWQTRHMIQLEGGLQSVARRAKLHLDARYAYLSRGTHPASVATEPICCPLCRGREVEFVIRVASRSTDERFETRVPPKLIGTRGRHCGRLA